MLSVSPVILNSELSVSPVPLTKEYVGFWPFRYAFCAVMLPITSVSLFILLSSNGTIYHGPRFCLNLPASLNMSSMLVTLLTFHADMSWLKSMALLNIRAMLVTPETSHEDMSWLKPHASLNIPDMSVIPETFHEFRCPLNLLHSNIPFAFLSEDTFHEETSTSTVSVSPNIWFIFVTLETSQSAMSMDMRSAL